MKYWYWVSMIFGGHVARYEVNIGPFETKMGAEVWRDTYTPERGISDSSIGHWPTHPAINKSPEKWLKDNGKACPNCGVVA